MLPVHLDVTNPIYTLYKKKETHDHEFENIPSDQAPAMLNTPFTNVKDLETGFEIEIAVPGFAKTDLKIKIEENILKVSSVKKESNHNYTWREFNYSNFERSFILPHTVDESGIKAEYKNGLLQLIAPKKNHDNRRRAALKTLNREVLIW